MKIKMSHMIILENVSFAHSSDLKCAQKSYLAYATLLLDEFTSYLELRCILRFKKKKLSQDRFSIFPYALVQGVQLRKRVCMY